MKQQHTGHAGAKDDMMVLGDLFGYCTESQWITVIFRIGVRDNAALFYSGRAVSGRPCDRGG